ncbi:MAG: xanthine dehydrogenase accessory protein XdhC [Alphaproteobacteria bacterium]
MKNWLTALADLGATGETGVLVTVIETEGSTPREPGAKMTVSAATTHGTIGGGHLEFKATALARELIENGGAAPLIRRFALGPSLGQCCGGGATLLFEPIRPPGFALYLFGAGHVGRALVRVFADAPCCITWIDSREDSFPAELPDNVVAEFSEAPECDVADAPAGSDFLVMTHSHAVDLRICQAVLERGDFHYLGLIGSRTKRRKFERRLRQRGIDEPLLARLTCPIGISGIPGKRPSEIAIATAAELLKVHGARDGAAATENDPGEAADGGGAA